MGIGPQCRTDVREGLLIVAGLVHTSLWEGGGGRCLGLHLLPPSPLLSSSDAHWTHLVEGLGVHRTVALLKHTTLLQQHGAVGLCTHLWRQWV